MIDTARIASGFDVEFQLAGGWFQTALSGLAEKGLLVPPGTISFIADDTLIEVTAVEIIFDRPGQDLSIDLLIGELIPFTIEAALSLSDDGTELILETSLPGDPTHVPFDAFSGLAGAPELIKLAGDEEHESVIALLANLNIRASSQAGAPLPAGEHLPRGDRDNARAFVTTNQHVGLGIASATLQRFANDIWHNQLTDDDGNQPFPDSNNSQGDWQSVSMSVENGRIRATLRAVAQVDTPIIDIIPDPDITISVDLTPILVDGALTFEMNVDANIDFGILGDLLAGLVGGIIGFVIGLFTGNPIAGAVIGAGVGVVVLEVAEFIAGGVIAREIQAQIDGQPLTRFYRCRDNVIYLSTVPDQGQGLNLGFLDALPASIPIFIDNPDPLHERAVLVRTMFEDTSLNAGGFGIEGASEINEHFTPVDASIVGKTSVADSLASLLYRTADGEEHELTLTEVLDRAASDDVPEPLRVSESSSDDLIERKQEGKIPIACMHPVAIHREDTIVTAIRFSTGLELDALDTIRLQDEGVLLLPGLQLIHPVDGRPYYRAPADDRTENNFENLPEF